MKDFFNIIFFIFILGFSFCSSGLAQNKKELEQQKKENIDKIHYTRSLLDKTQQDRKNSLNQLNLIEKGIEYRVSLINNLEQQRKNIDIQIEKINSQINKNKGQIERLREEYARIVRKSYQNIDKQLPLMYILSAEDINQGYQRLKYLKYLNDYRKQTVGRITSLNDSLILRKDELNEAMDEKNNTLNQIKEEKEKLSQDRTQKSSLVTSLQKKEKELRAELKRREAVQNEIEAEIKRILEEEARKAKVANSVSRMTPAERLIAEDFGNNKGRLPWPTAKGVVVTRFGEQEHPVLKGIKIHSNGIDIGTTENSLVRAVFRGRVTKVIAILGTNYTIIIKHGDFWSVYQNIVDVLVKAGDVVDVKQPIGKVYTDEANVSKLHFEIWKDRNVVDPLLWLSR